MLALGDDGNVYAWGHSYYGLGDGVNTSSTVPIPIQRPAGVAFTAISAGKSHGLALGDDGNVYAWGYNNHFGQLGDGTFVDSDVPVQVQAPAGVTFTAIDTGDNRSIALGSDGKAYAWGWGGYGLGDGSEAVAPCPCPCRLRPASRSRRSAPGTTHGPWSATTATPTLGARTGQASSETEPTPTASCRSRCRLRRAWPSLRSAPDTTRRSPLATTATPTAGVRTTAVSSAPATAPTATYRCRCSHPRWS